jgi:hypothetical protein
MWPAYPTGASARRATVDALATTGEGGVRHGSVLIPGSCGPAHERTDRWGRAGAADWTVREPCQCRNAACGQRSQSRTSWRRAPRSEEAYWPCFVAKQVWVRRLPDGRRATTAESWAPSGASEGPNSRAPTTSCGLAATPTGSPPLPRAVAPRHPQIIAAQTARARKPSTQRPVERSRVSA